MLQVPNWSDLSWLRHGFSERINGHSHVYAAGESPELNLGFTAHDDPALVAANRTDFTRSVSTGDPMPLITVRQVHGDSLRHVTAADSSLLTPEGRVASEADALTTAAPGFLLGIQVADCVPVLVVDPVHRAVAAFHAGWRGTLAQIVEHGITRMHTLYGSAPHELRAAIGPCIGPCCYTVGEEVDRLFSEAFPYAPHLLRRTGPNLHLDLVEANRRQLLSSGLRPELIWTTGLCTSCARTPAGRRRFFSHRAESGFTGRLMAAIGIAC